MNSVHDPRKLKEVTDRELLNFRSFTDTAAGEGLGVISSAWNIEGTPTLFMVDHKGVISYRGLGIPNEKAIDEVLEKLIHEVGE